jgi:hypothetical protein
VTLDKAFYNLLFKQELVVAARVTSKFSSSSHSFFRDMINVLCINYVIIICFTDNDAVINNSYGRLPDLILLFKITIGTREDFFEIYRQFGYAPSKTFASPILS